MTLNIRNNLLNVGNVGLPAAVDRLAAVRALAGLKGLYMFEDGVIGSAYTTAPDLSGLGNNAMARSAAQGFVVPTRVAEGILMGAGDASHQGTVFDTPIPFSVTTGWTAIVGYTSLTGETVSGANTQTSLIDSSLRPTGNKTVSSATGMPPPLIKSIFNTSGTAYDSGELEDVSGTWFGAATVTRPTDGEQSAASKNDTGKWAILGARVDPINKVLSVNRNVQAPLPSAAALLSGFTTPVANNVGNFCFGQFANRSLGGGSYVPNGKLAFVVLCNAWNSDAAYAAARDNLIAVAAKRPILFG